MSRNNNKRAKFQKSSRKSSTKTYSKGFSKEAEDIKNEVSHKYNDWTWYANTSQLLTDSASLSFNTAVGGPVDLRGNDYGGNTNAVPGVMSIGIRLVPGISVDNSSPINIAANNVYSFVRHANSGHSNYDSPDLMMYLLAMDSVYAYFNYLKRAYGVCRTYSMYNRYLPEAVVKAMGIDFDDLQANLANFRYYLNNYAVKASALATPSTMPMFIRHSWMFSNVYKDADSDKAQLYVFRPTGFWKLSEVGSESGTSLTNMPTTGKLFKVSELMRMGNELLAAIIESEDMNIMSGDILKAYGNQIFSLTTVEENYTVEPVYNSEVLGQINNLTVVGAIVDAGENSITQNPNTGAILYDPTFVNYPGFGLRRILNAVGSATTPADVMVDTRLTVLPRNIEDVLENGTAEFHLDQCGSEVVATLSVWRYVITEAGGRVLTSFPVDQFVSMEIAEGATLDDSATVPVSLLKNSAMLSKFDRHPYIYYMQHVAMKDGSFQTHYYDFLGDVENFTTIGKDELYKLHQTALLSELGVPAR